jgi:hypothetical protein
MSQAKKNPPRFSARSRKQLTETLKYEYDQPDGKYSLVDDRMLEVSCSILYENSRVDNATLKKYGLRIKDASKTAWQLVPLSFMVDRVSNISQAISAISNLNDPGLRILAASVVTRASSNKSLDLKMAYHNTHQFNVDNVMSLKTYDYTREVWNPSASDAIPGFSPGNLVEDARSIVDLLALTIQRLI